MVMNRSYRPFAGAGLLVVALALAGCQSATEDPTPTDAPSSAASAEPSTAASEAPATPSAETGSDEGVETSVFDLEVGFCFSTDSDQLETVIVVDCEQPHEHEVFALVNHPAGDAEEYPGDDAVVEYADTECRSPFEEYVDRDYETSIWYITSLTPSAETWTEGDREVVCTLNQQDADEEPITVTGSAEGSGD